MVDYVLSDFKWGAAEFGTASGLIEWSFAQTAGDIAPYESFITAPVQQQLVRDAFDVWSQVTAVTFIEVADSADVDIRLGWAPLDGLGDQVGYTWLVAYPNPTDGEAGRIGSAEVIFDLAEEWDFGKEPDLSRPSFYATAIHEIGHALGMDHTPEGSLSMMAAFQAEITELQPVDVDGIQVLYGTVGEPNTGDDRLAGTSTTDVIDALAGADTVSGLMGDDDLRGGPGDDLLDGGIGNDILNGGNGFDTALYSGEQTAYSLVLTPSQISLTDRRSDGSGTDTLIDIERLDFEVDAFPFDFDLTAFAGTRSLSQDDFETFIELYIAYFNRAPDAVGLNFWGTAFANGTTLEQMATLFVDQDETRSTYPEGTTNNAFATSVYENVLGRTPDQSGIDFWVGLLDGGLVSRDQFILEVLRGAKSELKPEEGQAFVDQQLADRAYLETKVDIGAYFAVHQGMSDVTNATFAMSLFDGSEASVASAVSQINEFYADALEPNSGEFIMQVTGLLDTPFDLML